MRATKTRISNLKSRIAETLPDGLDIYGFPGISKKLIIDTLEDCYVIVTSLDEYEKKFEAILLERKASDYFEKATKLLKEDFNQKKGEFNELLNIISKLHFRVKEVYIAVAKEPIRTETQIQQSKNELVELQAKIEEIKPFYEEILSIKDNVEDFESDLEDKHLEAIKNSGIIQVDMAAIEALKTASEDSAEEISTWEKEIKELKGEIASKTVLFEELKTKIEILRNDAAATYELNKKYNEKYKEQVDANATFQEQIQKTIEDANRHGMAGSFKKRKDELNQSLLYWRIATIASIILLIIFSTVLLSQFKPEDFQVSRVLARLPIFASCIWLGWFCAKQYGFTSRIMEDYAYKYAVSMAFEGYKNSTKDIDPKLQVQLLELTIGNISRNPLSIYETLNNHGTPIHELVNGFPKNLSLKKKIDKLEAEIKIEDK